MEISLRWRKCVRLLAMLTVITGQKWPEIISAAVTLGQKCSGYRPLTAELLLTIPLADIVGNPEEVKICGPISYMIRGETARKLSSAVGNGSETAAEFIDLNIGRLYFLILFNRGGGGEPMYILPPCTVTASISDLQLAA